MVPSSFSPDSPKPPPALPARVLSGRIFQGQAPQARADNLEALARYSNPAETAATLRRAMDAGIGGLLTLGEASVLAAMRTLRGEGRAPVLLPVLPNVSGYIREATEFGLVGAGLRRLARMGPVGMARAGLAGLRHPMRVLRKDFPAMLEILYELEMGEFARFRPPVVFLHHQMTDLFLSFGNAQFFHDYARAMRRRFGTEPGLATSNFALLGQRLIEWGVAVRFVCAPLNRENFLMPGGLEAYRALLATGRFQLVADRVGLYAPTRDAEAEWAAGIAGVAAVAVEHSDAPDRAEAEARDLEVLSCEATV
jgi:hypothetical protein